MIKNSIVKAKTDSEAMQLAIELTHLPESEIKLTLVEKGKKGFFKTEPSTYEIAYALTPCEAAKEFINTLSDNLGLDIQVQMSEPVDNSVTITLVGDGASTLIGHHGETLDAFQYIVNLVANKKDSETRQFTRFTVDIENYREKREDSLRQLAIRISEKVKKTKRYVILEPMNAYERRIIHSTVQTIDGVSTNSIGTEGNRRVVIFLEGNGEFQEGTFTKTRHNDNRRNNQHSSVKRQKDSSYSEKSSEQSSTSQYRYNADKAHTPPRKIEKAKDLDSYFAKLKEFSITLQNDESEDVSDVEEETNAQEE